MKFYSATLISVIASFAPSLASGQTFNTFELVALKTGSPIHHSTVKLNHDLELVIDSEYQPFRGDWYKDHTVQYHDTSYWLTVKPDYKVVVGYPKYKWDVTGGYYGNSDFKGYLETHKSTKFYAVPYYNGKGYYVYTDEYKPKDEKVISFSLTPYWHNYTVTHSDYNVAASLV